MVGVPAYWQDWTLTRSMSPKLLDVLKMADVISPWTVGRYSTPSEAAKYADNTLKPDLKWCQRQGINYDASSFPGFQLVQHERSAIQVRFPGCRGNFYGHNFRRQRKAGVSMVYVAMFDEVDEGTAIFKCANNVPVGQQSKFLTFDGMPSDFIKAGGEWHQINSKRTDDKKRSR